LLLHRLGLDDSAISGIQSSNSNIESQTEPARNFKKALLENYKRQSVENEANQPQPSTSTASPSVATQELPSTSKFQLSINDEGSS
jgi:hypothetical protein